MPSVLGPFPQRLSHPTFSKGNMPIPQSNPLDAPNPNTTLAYWPYSNLSTNYGHQYTCRELYNRLLDARSAEEILRPEFMTISIERHGPSSGPSDPFLPRLLTSLSEHEDISTLFLHDVDWSHFSSRHSWHSSIIGFPNITYLTMTDCSLQADEFFSLVRSLPLQGLEVHNCSITGALHMHPFSTDASSIIPNHEGPEILYLDVTVSKDSNILEIFTQPWSPVSFSKLEKLAISGKGDSDIGQQIARLVEISTPLELNINCDGLNLVHPPPIAKLSEVKNLVVVIPLDGTNDFRRTNDCLRWWTSSLKQVPRPNRISNIRIVVLVDQQSIANAANLPSGGRATWWIYFDEILSDTKKFKLHRKFAVTISMKQNTATGTPFDTQVYNTWIQSDALVESFERHLGISLRRHA